MKVLLLLVGTMFCADVLAQDEIPPPLQSLIEKYTSGQATRNHVTLMPPSPSAQREIFQEKSMGPSSALPSGGKVYFPAAG